MNNKGFTLIELLVVVILIAAIVLLALPKITNSVKNNSANVDKTTFSIIKEATKLYISDNENSFMKRSENTYCVSLNTLIEEKYLKNTIEYNNQDITDTKVMKVTYDNGFNYELVDKEDCERVVKFDTVCEADSEQLYATNELDIGYKYNCKVDPNKPRYSFYVLSYNDEDGNIIFDKENAKSANLIMDRNMCSDGTPTAEGKTCLVAWNNETGQSTNANGPVTAMTYLNNATNTWTNTNEMLVDKFDNDAGSKFDMQAYNTYARLPYYSEVGCFNNNNGYLYENLDNSYWDYGESTKPTNNISGIYGYWTLSSFSGISDDAWCVNYYGIVNNGIVVYDNHSGVRSVINLKI